MVAVAGHHRQVGREARRDDGGDARVERAGEAGDLGAERQPGQRDARPVDAAERAQVVDRARDVPGALAIFGPVAVETGGGDGRMGPVAVGGTIAVDVVVVERGALGERTMADVEREHDPAASRPRVAVPVHRVGRVERGARAALVAVEHDHGRPAARGRVAGRRRQVAVHRARQRRRPVRVRQRRRQLQLVDLVAGGPIGGGVVAAGRELVFADDADRPAIDRQRERRRGVRHHEVRQLAACARLPVGARGAAPRRQAVGEQLGAHAVERHRRSRRPRAHRAEHGPPVDGRVEGLRSVRRRAREAQGPAVPRLHLDVGLELLGGDAARVVRVHLVAADERAVAVAVESQPRRPSLDREVEHARRDFAREVTLVPADHVAAVGRDVRRRRVSERAVADAAGDHALDRARVHPLRAGGGAPPEVEHAGRLLPGDLVDGGDAAVVRDRGARRLAAVEVAGQRQLERHVVDREVPAAGPRLTVVADDPDLLRPDGLRRRQRCERPLRPRPAGRRSADAPDGEGAARQAGERPHDLHRQARHVSSPTVARVRAWLSARAASSDGARAARSASACRR